METIQSSRRSTRVIVAVMAILAATFAAALAFSQPADASSHLVVQGNVNGHPDSPRYELHGGWVTGASMTVEIWDTAAKGTLLFTDTFVFDGALGPRGSGPGVPGNHFVVTQGSDSVEFTLADLTIEIDGVENIVSGTMVGSNEPLSLNVLSKEGQDLNICPRSVPIVGGIWETDYDEPMPNPDVPGCSPTWDPGPGDSVKVTDNSGVPCCQTISEARVIDFTDEDGSIFETDILWLAQEGITKGCNPPDNDMFCPDDNVTRGQMAAFLVRALGLTDDGGGDLFIDDDDSVFQSNIDKLATAGITKGCNPPTNDMFCPDDNVTRGQMAAFLRRALG